MLYNFYSPLPYYIGAVIAAVGIPLVKATKLVFLFGYLIGIVGIYIFLRRYTDTIATLVGTVLFLTSTYLAFDVYFRGALAEFYAFMFVPWVLYGWSQVKESRSYVFILIAALSYALLFISHTLIGFATFLLLLIFFIFPPITRTTVKRVLLTLLLSLGLSAFFWLPSAVEQQYIRYQDSYFGAESYKGNFINPLQAAGLQEVPWPFSPPILGLGLTLGAIFSVIMFFRSKRKDALYAFFILAFFITTFLTWDASRFLWDRISYLQYMTFPYRFLTLTTVISIVLTAFGLALVKNHWRKILLGIVFVLPAITVNYHYLRPTAYTYVSTYTADDACGTTGWDQEHLQTWVKECFSKKKKYPLVASIQKTTISNTKESQNGRDIQFSVQGKKARIILAKYYYPGWTATVDGETVKTEAYSKHGLVSFVVPAGQHEVRVQLTNTVPQTAGNIISLLSLIVSIVLGIIIVRRRRSVSRSSSTKKRPKKLARKG